MDFKELKEKRRELYEKYEKENQELDKQYALENNPVKIGDIVTDHYHTIKVESMMQTTSCEVPQMKYYGTELKKDGKPKKVQPRTKEPVFQRNIKKINGEPYSFNNR